MKQLVLIGLLVSLLGPGCSEDQSAGLCGNGRIDPGETWGPIRLEHWER
jgi:hypothetical protein